MLEDVRALLFDLDGVLYVEDQPIPGRRGREPVMDGAKLIALQKNRYWKRADGLSLDVGPFVAAIEYATLPAGR